MEQRQQKTFHLNYGQRRSLVLELILRDVVELCSGARFCDVGGGTWVLTEKSDDPAAKQKAIQQTFDCPSGRLVAIDKDTGKPIEPLFEKSISATEDQVSGISGPLWVKGGIPVESSDGTMYEIRNRVTLCRCGRSANKPFCDGKAHGKRLERGGILSSERIRQVF